jgi:simple sugar transport system substrate-binding protein/ribose transport system substrate-binding protein
MRALLSLTLGLVLLATPDGATVLGVITPEQAGEPATRAAKAAQASAEEKSWTVEQRSGAAASDLARVKVDALLLVGVRPEAQAATVEAARKAGAPVVTVLAGASPQAAFDVTVNQYVAGAQIGAYLLGLADYRGPLLELRADAEPGAKARARVLALMLQQEAPEVQSLGSLQRAAGDRWQDALKRGLEQKLQQAGSGPLAVWAATDELALAAEDVLKAAGYGRDRVALVGTGGTDAAFDRLRDQDGLLAATLAIPYELLGEAAVDALDDLMAGTPPRQVTPGPYLYIEPVLVDRNNVPGPDELPW